MAGEIVVGYDGSTGARTALDKAIEMAGKLGGEIVLVYGFEVSRLGGEVADFATALRERGESSVAEGVEIVRAAGLEPRTEIVEADPAEAIADVAADLGAQMIVVATHRERPLRGILVGTMAPKLLHLSSVPVLVVQIP